MQASCIVTLINIAITNYQIPNPYPQSKNYLGTMLSHIALAQIVTDCSAVKRLLSNLLSDMATD